MTVLGLSDRQIDELDRNRELAEPRALPASQVYTGVLYAALDYESLTPAARKRADRLGARLVGPVGRGTPVRSDPRVPAVR